MSKAKMKPLDWIAYILLVVGALVHGGQAFGFYAVELLPSFLPKVIYGIVGIAGLYAFFTMFKLIKISKI